MLSIFFIKMCRKHENIHNSINGQSDFSNKPVKMASAFGSFIAMSRNLRNMPIYYDIHCDMWMGGRIGSKADCFFCGLFYYLRLYNVEWYDELWTGKNLKVSGSSLFDVISPNCQWKTEENSDKLVKIAGVPDEIRAE